MVVACGFGDGLFVDLHFFDRLCKEKFLAALCGAFDYECVVFFYSAGQLYYCDIDFVEVVGDFSGGVVFSGFCAEALLG